MSSLYKIEQDLLAILQQVEEQDGVLDADTEQLLAIKREELEFKVIGYDQAIKYLIGEGLMAQMEIDRIQKFIADKEKIIESLRKSLLQALLLFGKEDKKGIKRLKFGTIELSTRRSKSIEITDENEIDDKFKKVDLTLKDLTFKQLGQLHTILYGDDTSLVDNSTAIEFRETVKISKTELKPVTEEHKQILLNLENLYKENLLTETEYNDRVSDVENIMIKGAEQIEKVNLVIK